MDDVWQSLNESGIIIAEVSGRDANVMYEIGIAHAIGKKVVMIAQDAGDIPFDLQRHRFIVYDNTEDGLRKLKDKLMLSVSQELGL